MIQRDVFDGVIEDSMIDDVIQALAGMAVDHVRRGWKAELLTGTYRHLRGSDAAVIAQMRDSMGQVYGTLVPRVVRRPRSPAAVDRLPVLIAAPDLPVAKLSRKRTGVNIEVNRGLHMHGVLMTPPRSRLRTSIVEHFRTNEALYARDPIARIDVRPIDLNVDAVVDYVLKSIRRRRVSYDDLLILPRASSEPTD